MQHQWKPVPSETSALLDAITFSRLEYQSGLDPIGCNKVWWSAMIDLNGVSIDTFVENIRPVFPKDFLIPVAYDADDRSVVHVSQLIVIFARKPLLDALNKLGNPFGVANVHLGNITPTEWLDFQASPPEFVDTPVAADAVVMATIDDGIGIAHELFRDTTVSTRVEFCAVLAAKPDKEARNTTQGRNWSKDQIDDLLEKNTWSDLLDDDRFYSQTGQTDFRQGEFSPVSLRRSHGTHVMGLAAGFAPNPSKKDRRIICATLPPSAVEDTSGNSLLPSLCLALQILSKKAQSFKSGDQIAPLVLNLSYGNFSGAHDGTSEVSRLFEQFLNACEGQKRWMTLPAGNGNLARSHAKLSFENPKTASVDLDLRVLPDDRTATHVEMWMPHCAKYPPSNFVSVEITTPFGQVSLPVEAREGQSQSLCDSHGRVVARLMYTFDPAPTNRGIITLVIYPTGSLDTDLAIAPSGRWKISTTPIEIASDQTIEVWIQRDETLPGYRPGGRQAYFDNDDYKRFGKFGQPLPVDPPNNRCPVQRAGTLSGFADGASPMVIAGYTKATHLLSEYSAAGPLTKTPMTPVPDRNGPDASAEADASPVVKGVLSAGSKSGSYVRFNGTSVAAPRVARCSANAIKDGPESAREWVCAEVENRPFELKGKPSKTRSGCGGLSIKVNFENPKANL